jgi:hypothetical protein
MKLILDERKCKTVPAKTPEVDAALREEAVKRAHRTKVAASEFSSPAQGNTGHFRGSIHPKKHEKGYSVDIDDDNALSIIFGHEYDGWAEGHAPFEGHPEVIHALLAP